MSEWKLLALIWGIGLTGALAAGVYGFVRGVREVDTRLSRESSRTRRVYTRRTANGDQEILIEEELHR